MNKMSAVLPSKRLLLSLSIGYAAVIALSSTILYHLIRSGAASQELCQTHFISDTTPTIEAIYTSFFIPFLPSGLTFVLNLIIFCLLTIGLPILLLRKRNEHNAALGPAVFIATILLTVIVPLSIHFSLLTLTNDVYVTMGYLLSPLVSGIIGIAIFTLIAKQTNCSLSLKHLLANYACLFATAVIIFVISLRMLPGAMIIEAVPVLFSLNYGWVLALLLTAILSQADKIVRIVSAVFVAATLFVPILVGLIL